jgi:glucan-binding YG repeat protein
MKGQTQSFTATVTGTNNPSQGVTWMVTGGGAGTSINTSGQLTVSAAETASSLTVRATSTVDTSKYGTATVTLNAIPPTVTVTSVTVSPATATVMKGQTRSFAATVTGTNYPSQSVTWTVTGGGSGTYIDSSGLLTVSATETASRLTVRATSYADATKSGSASVTLTDIPAPEYIVTTIVGAGGSVTGSGRYRYGASVTLTAFADAGYSFDGWYENGIRISGGSAAYSFTVSYDRTLEARFTKINNNGFSYNVDGWYYYDGGERKTGFIEVEGFVRYFDPADNGRMAIGWTEINNEISYFTDEGKMLSGWNTVDGYERYFFDGSIVKDGFHYADGWWRHFHNNGVPHQVGFDVVDGYWRYFDERSKMLIPGLYFIEGKWRHIMDGSIVAPEGFFLAENRWRYVLDGGIIAPQGFYEVYGKWRYILDGGIVAPIGWYTVVDGVLRYAADGGVMLPEGWHFIDGANRYILEGSIPASGWHTVDGKAIFFDAYGLPLY